MLFWIVVAVISALVTWAVTRPLTREASEIEPASAADVAVYKDQLAEIEADRTRGAIGAEDAELARNEIARRLLRRSGEGATNEEAPRPGGAFARPFYVATTIALPIASLALYLMLGAPGQPGIPLSERLSQNLNQATTNDLVARVEARLRDHPEDGQGWNVIAPVYFSMGRFEESAGAFVTAMRLLGETPDRLQGFANARIRADNGIIGEDARLALEKVIAAEPKRQEPRIWLALAKEQDGKREAAAADYRALLAEAPPDAPYKPFLEDRLAGVTGEPAKAPAPQGADAATEAPAGVDAAAVAAMTPEERTRFVNGMVERLAKRLAGNGRDAEGWMMLIRAYQMLGRKADAEQALKDARRGLEGDSAALSGVDGLARELGLGG